MPTYRLVLEDKIAASLPVRATVSDVTPRLTDRPSDTDFLNDYMMQVLDYGVTDRRSAGQAVCVLVRRQYSSPCK